MFLIKEVLALFLWKKFREARCMCKVIEEKQIAKISDFEVVAFTECFKISLIEDGKSIKIIESYVGDIKAFKEFLGTEGVEFNGCN